MKHSYRRFLDNSMVKLSAGVTLATLMMGSAAAGTIFTVPPGLAPGQQYRLIFYTAGTRDGSSINIADYNTFVTNQANTNATLTGLGTSWMAVASTATVNAFDNIGGAFSVPVYNLNGQLVATGSAGLWGGSLTNAIGYDQNGTFSANHILTGTNSNGLASAQPLGASPNVSRGRSDLTTSSWINESNSVGNNVAYKLFAFSATLTAPAATPEPSTVGLATIGLAALGFFKARQRGSKV